MRILKHITICLLLLSSILVSCKHDPVTIVTPEPEPCDTAAVTYNSSVYPILADNCIACHSGPQPQGGLDFTIYDNVALVAQSGALYGSITHAQGYTPMPQGGSKLSDCDIATIRIWIQDTTFVDTIPAGNPCDPDTVYFQNDILPILMSSCGIAGCHDPVTAQDGIVLTNYASVMATGKVEPYDPDNSDLYEAITETDPDKIMPPSGEKPPLNSAQIQLFYKWIMQGALDNSCTSTDCDTVNITYSSTIWPIIQNSCKGCHSGSNPSGSLLLDEYNAIASVAANGKLLGTIRHEAGYPFMPKNGLKLSDCKITQIEKWINNGYPND